jgi:hypothetical protein
VNISDDGEWRYDEQKGDWVPAMSNTGHDPQSTMHSNPKDALGPPVAVSKSSKSAKVSPMNKNVRTLVDRSIIGIIIGVGFLMLIFSESYNYSATYTIAPEAPAQPVSSDFDLDGSGSLNLSENGYYEFALDLYNDAYAVYSNDLKYHNDLMTIYAGKAIFYGNIAPGFIVAGLVCMTFQSKAYEMSNSIRLTLLIGTIYMVANMLGYDMPGVNAAIGLGFGG